MARIVDENLENRTRHGSGRSQETPLGVDQIAPAASAEHDGPIADDMPDIIDVVLEMGRAPEETAAEARAPSPPLPASATSRLPAHLDALADRARDDVVAGRATRTRRA